MPRAMLVLLLSSYLAAQILPAARGTPACGRSCCRPRRHPTHQLLTSLHLPPAPAADFPGDVYCWGLNSARQLGAAELGPLTGTTLTTGTDDGSGAGGASSSSGGERNATGPWDPTLLDTNYIFQSISADNTYVCGVTTRGTIVCWGGGHSRGWRRRKPSGRLAAVRCALPASPMHSQYCPACYACCRRRHAHQL
jgi:hypothetical protein